MSWAITEKGCSQRRACLLVGIAPKTYRYRSGRGADDDVRVRLRVLASERRRFGYRRLHILLAREGVRLNHKRLFRIYREERLGVRKRGSRKRALCVFRRKAAGDSDAFQPVIPTEASR